MIEQRDEDRELATAIVRRFALCAHGDVRDVYQSTIQWCRECGAFREHPDNEWIPPFLAAEAKAIVVK